MPARRPSAATREAVAAAVGRVSDEALTQIEADHRWYAALPADQRASVGLVARAGVRTFAHWFVAGEHDRADTAEVFGAAPADLARVIPLAHTLDLVRTVVDVVERETQALAAPGDGSAVREALLRYTREIAFAAAQVYADVAESRGAWDARLESLVVDAVLRGEADTSMQSRAAALGWGQVEDVSVLVGPTPTRDAQLVVDALHRVIRRLDTRILAAIHGRRVVCIVGGSTAALEVARMLDDQFGPGPLVVGPRVPHLFAAGRSARAAISGFAAAPAWPDAPRPVLADDLLAERALLGDQPARIALVSRIIEPLRAMSDAVLLETAAAYLDGGRGLEATARALYVHANTVRYRLGRIAAIVGYDLTDAHDAQTVRLALSFDRLTRAGQRTIRAEPG